MRRRCGLRDIGDQGWSVLAGDLPLPLAVIRRDVLTANSRWMTRFAAENGLVIAPHGKTTMAPQLFDLQIADGAWAITVATMQQLEVCRHFGVRRVIIANQPIGAQSRSTRAFARCGGSRTSSSIVWPTAWPESALLAEGARRNPPPETNPLRVLVEIGFMGGRAGARNSRRMLSRSHARSPQRSGLAARGVRVFRRSAAGPGWADGLIEEVAAIAAIANDEGLLPAGAPMILSAGGSAFFDRVGEKFDAVSFDRPVLQVLRSGCYLTHDSIGYAAAFRRIVAETTLHLPEGGLEPALEVWAYVQSRPENGRTILTMGKRDVSYDSGPAGTAALVSAGRNDGATGADAAGPRGRRPQRPALPSRHTG